MANQCASPLLDAFHRTLLPDLDQDCKELSARGRFMINPSNVFDQSVEAQSIEEKTSEMLDADTSLKYSRGVASPLGVSVAENGINFAVFSRHATRVSLCLSKCEREDNQQMDDGMLEVPLDPQINKTGDVWHIYIEMYRHIVPKVSIRGEEEFGRVILRRVVKVEKSYRTIPIFRRACGSSGKTCCPQIPLTSHLEEVSSPSNASCCHLAEELHLLMSFHATLHCVTIFKRVVKVSDPPCIMPLYSKEVQKHGGSFQQFVEALDALGEASHCLTFIVEDSSIVAGGTKCFTHGLSQSGIVYGYRIDGPQGWGQGHRFDSSVILLDPYAKLVSGRKRFGDVSDKMSKFLGTYDFTSPPFDWGPDYKLPNIPETDLVIYEMNVRAFTADGSSGLDPDICGSYLGVIEKIPYLLELGINAVELLPAFEFDEFEFQRYPNPRNHMLHIVIRFMCDVFKINTWGYSTMNFFAPMSRYASSGGGSLVASHQFKEMVKALHNARIAGFIYFDNDSITTLDDSAPSIRLEALRRLEAGDVVDLICFNNESAFSCLEYGQPLVLTIP
ncbi:hypothetical protein ZIOFF_070117 [Zingiber officinale]|uniref:Glycoside hydrolase family 13 N-terminal domain-containing protein n=1 Tax=Zingiber officinale TaxID=94328 RepID=A0A8J5ESA1_ZINOF|nr:hypothetical protein ZIOFF_070117 [Zingiber officinale]